MRKFYKTVYSVVVLSEETPIHSYDDLAAIHYAITDGDCSGEVSKVSEEEVSAPEMAKLLIAQSSDPGFFSLDAEGNTVES